MGQALGESRADAAAVRSAAKNPTAAKKPSAAKKPAAAAKKPAASKKPAAADVADTAPRQTQKEEWRPELGWPTREFQLASYCGDMHELIKYAKLKHGTTGGMSSTQVKNWLKKNPDFIPRWLAETEWAVDHIISDKHGGHPWPFNYFIMPQSDNSHFNQWADAEKRKYVGMHAWETASSFARWARDAARARIDYGKFDPVTDQFRGRA